MLKRVLFRSIIILAIILLTACTLPEMTPPVELATETESPAIHPVTENPSPTAPSIPEPVAITSKNSATLTAVYKSAVINPQQLVWASDGLSLAVSTQNSNAGDKQLFGITLLSAPDLNPIGIFSSEIDRISDISSDGKTAALISLDMNSFSLIDLSSSNSILHSITPGYLIGNVTFSPDGNTIAVTKMDSWEVVLFAVSDGTELKTLSGFETAAPVFQAGFKEAPQWIVWNARATLQLQEIESGVYGPKLDHQDFVMAYALTADGSIIASVAAKIENDASIPVVVLWDAAQGVELSTLQLESMAQCLAFSPNGSLLAVGIGNAIQIWDVASGTMLISLAGHSGYITDIAFSPDGKFIASAGQDNQLYLWQVME